MITLPDRLPDEGDRAYAAFVAYCVMGTQRSLQPLAKKLGKSSTIIERWSRLYDWRNRVMTYDASMHAIAAEAHAREHLSDLEQLRERSKGLADKLLDAAEAILDRIKDKAKDGEIYINTQSLSAASNAIKAGLDIHSHGLGIDELIPKLKADLDAANEASDD